MRKSPLFRTLFLFPAVLVLIGAPACCAQERLAYGHSGQSDLGVGLWAWPLPMDYDGDGDIDLIVSCPDVPFNGIYYFENPSDGKSTMPIFKPPVRLSKGLQSIQVSYVDGQARVMTPATEWIDFRENSFSTPKSIYPKTNIHTPGRKIRANQWRYVDYDGNGIQDLIVGVGDWQDYGWDDAFDANGKWTAGPLRGYVYLIANSGSNESPDYESPVQILANGQPIDVFGMPSPNFADFDSDGDLDLICGEFLDGFTYFQNIGTRQEPIYAAGTKLTSQGIPLKMDLQMITPTAFDWDRDGDIDLIVGDEDGRVAWIEHLGLDPANTPIFSPPKYFQQEAQFLKFGALATPSAIDWDGDGDEDIITGNSAGYIALIENLKSKLNNGNPPQWAAPKLLTVSGTPIRIQAGENGSIQGPAEAKWGYTAPTAIDWDHDGIIDIVCNSIWGEIVWYQGLKKSSLEMAPQQKILVQWETTPPKPAWNWWTPAPQTLVTQWRTTPTVIDINNDGLNDLVMLDHEGYLAFFERKKMGNDLVLMPGKRIFQDQNNNPLRLNDGYAGKSGRRKLCWADWDGDGRIDLMVNSVNVNFFRNVSTADSPWTFLDMGPISDLKLAGHTTSPTVVDWNKDSRPDLCVGAEDGHFYYFSNPYPQAIQFDVGSLKINGNGFELAPLKNESIAFSNRSYTWSDIPDFFASWQYTRTSGGLKSIVDVTSAVDRQLYIASSAALTDQDLLRWKEVTDHAFRYTDNNRTKMTVYVGEIKRGETLCIPQRGWTGTLLLIPPVQTLK